jgi:ABC-2 type transport system ATP-binding protein
MDNAIEITGLGKRYKGFALEDVGFAVPRGYSTGLIGPNGAGKTTIVKLIMNLIRRDAGDIRLFGLDNRRHEAEVKSRIGFVYDAPRFPEDLRLDTIASALSAFYDRWDEARFRALLEEFRLSPRQVFKKLSHGMKMKFSLALALAHDADLILMDEPTAGLDPVFRFELLNRLQALIQSERKTVFFSSHITTDLERIADHITFLRGGRIVFSTPKDDLLDRWAVVQGGKELLDPGLAGSFRAVRERDFYVEALTDDAAGIRRRLGERAVIEKASLEDIMFFLTRTNGHA